MSRYQNVVLMLAVSVLVPASVAAQSVGIGPRLSLVRGDLATETPSTRLLGGTVRMRSSSLTSLELSMDYRVTRNDARTERIRETPMQASLLIMPIRAALAPYALGGVGLYSQRVDTLGPFVSGAPQEVLDSTLSRKIGWHAGFGAELKLSRRAAVFVDYRYQFVKFTKTEDPATGTNIPYVDRVNFSHQGSMWTSGVAFYF